MIVLRCINKNPSHDTILKLSGYFIKREIELEKEREIERELDISIMTTRYIRVLDISVDFYPPPLV
jgi:hypothetical protein